MSDDPLTEDLVSYDPLSEVTRKERRALLGLSMLGLAISWVPLVPEKVGAFGIDFQASSQRSFVGLYGLLVLYYLVAFGVYAVTDYFAWRRGRVLAQKAYDRAVAQTEAKLEELRDSDEPPLPDGHPSFRDHMAFRGFASYWGARRAAAVRATFEFGLPVAFAVFSLWVLADFYFRLKA
jgi:hypothetical protein